MHVEFGCVLDLAEKCSVEVSPIILGQFANQIKCEWALTHPLSRLL